MKKIVTGIALSVFTFAFGQITLLEENFDGPDFPANWTMVDNDGYTVDEAVAEYTDAWIIKEDPDEEGNYTVSSTSYFSPVDRADRWLITPQITLGTEGNYISWAGKSHDPSFPDSYKVMISTTGNDITDFVDTIKVVPNEYYQWTSHTELLDEYAGETVYFAFVNTTYNGFKLYLDSIYVREQDPLAIQEIDVQVAVYPNPVTDFVSFETQGNKMNSVVIFNTLGEEVYQSELNDEFVSISTSEWKQGVYFAVVSTAKGTIRKKIVK